MNVVKAWWKMPPILYSSANTEILKIAPRVCGRELLLFFQHIIMYTEKKSRITIYHAYRRLLITHHGGDACNMKRNTQTHVATPEEKYIQIGMHSDFVATVPADDTHTR